MDKKSDGLPAAIRGYCGPDFCPVMTIGQREPVLCVRECAWYDTESGECAASRINANLKWLQDIAGYGGEITAVKDASED